MRLSVFRNADKSRIVPRLTWKGSLSRSGTPICTGVMAGSHTLHVVDDCKQP